MNIKKKPHFASFSSSPLHVFAKKGVKKGSKKPSKKVGQVLVQGTSKVQASTTSHLRQIAQKSQRQREDATTVPGLESRRVFCTFQKPPHSIATSEIACENATYATPLCVFAYFAPPTSGPKARKEATKLGRGAKLERGVGKHATKHGLAPKQERDVAKLRALSALLLRPAQRHTGNATRLPLRRARGVRRRPSVALPRRRVSSRVSPHPSAALPRARAPSLPCVALAHSSARRGSSHVCPHPFATLPRALTVALFRGSLL